MAKPSSSIDFEPTDEQPTPTPRASPLRSRHTPRAALGKRLRPLRVAKANAAGLATASTTPLDLATSMKPLLIGVGIGAAVMGAAMSLRSRGDREGVSPFHGPNAALAGALTKAALLALARAMSGEAIRTVTTRALLEVAEAWKA